MTSEQFELSGKDDSKFNVYKWGYGDKKPVVQIAHGMGEHAKKYDELANFLADKGFNVYANDHRGHGITGEKNGPRGFFGENNGWDYVVSDMQQLSNHIKEKHPDTKLFIIGHSMGSMLLRDYILQHSDKIDGAVIVGTGGHPGLTGYFGLIIAKIQSILFGKKSVKGLLNNLSNIKFNSNFKPCRTSYDWLSRDEKKVDEFVNDPL